MYMHCIALRISRQHLPSSKPLQWKLVNHSVQRRLVFAFVFNKMVHHHLFKWDFKDLYKLSNTYKTSSGKPNISHASSNIKRFLPLSYQLPNQMGAEWGSVCSVAWCWVNQLTISPLPDGHRVTNNENVSFHNRMEEMTDIICICLFTAFSHESSHLVVRICPWFV